MDSAGLRKRQWPCNNAGQLRPDDGLPKAENNTLHDAATAVLLQRRSIYAQGTKQDGDVLFIT